MSMDRNADVTAGELSTGAPDLAAADLFHDDRHLPVFEALRSTHPLYRQDAHPRFGSFWNVTRYNDILQIDLDDASFTAEDSFVLEDMDEQFPLPMFLAMDDPRHSELRDPVKPFFSQASMNRMRESIRQEVCTVLDALPCDETFDWVEQVSIALTSRILARMFDYPMEERDDLIRWSHMVLCTTPEGGTIAPEDPMRQQALLECLDVFSRLRKSRDAGGGDDLLSLLVQSGAGARLKPSEFLGNILMLIVAGNDTTRNSISAGASTFARHPEVFARLAEDPEVLRGSVLEILRLQSPIAYIRRRARVPYVLHGRVIQPGEKVLLWYASGNMDPTVFPDPERFDPARPNAFKMMAFGFGKHRCLGARLAELQLSLVWQEAAKRFSAIELAGPPVQVASSFIKGYASMPVRLTRAS